MLAAACSYSDSQCPFGDLGQGRTVVDSQAYLPMSLAGTFVVAAFVVDVVEAEEIDCGHPALVSDFAEYVAMLADYIYVAKVEAVVVAGPKHAAAVAVVAHSSESMHS